MQRYHPRLAAAGHTGSRCRRCAMRRVARLVGSDARRPQSSARVVCWQIWMARTKRLWASQSTLGGGASTTCPRWCVPTSCSNPTTSKTPTCSSMAATFFGASAIRQTTFFRICLRLLLPPSRDARRHTIRQVGTPPLHQCPKRRSNFLCAHSIAAATPVCTASPKS